MRKLIIALVLALFPFALWVSGCRRNDQATAFPKGPEVKNLSRAPQIASHTAAAPDIPAVIDPEILASPDQPTFARIRAVMDREAQLSNQYSTPGLFVLPRQDYPEMAVPPEPVFTSESAPALSSREFWSRPAAPLNQPPAQYQQYHDVSAMIPAGQFSSPEPREPSLPTEGIPGVFMGSDQIDAGPFSLAPPVSERLELSERTAAPTPQFPLLDDLKTDMARAIGRNQDPPVLPPLAWAPAQPEPAARSKTGGFLLNDDIRQALEPLPDISNLAGYKNAGQTPVSKTALPPLLTAEA
ncbi:MAG: hypothetical protein FWG74_05995, partial [Planctomycetes bacterium]|nr:hypothetical protein [Planctomycetota bacterium]